MATYLAGTLVTAQSVFTLANGTAVNPSTVDLRVLSPAGALTTPTPINPSTGTFTYQIDTTDQPGTWRIIWQAPAGSGCQAVAVDAFDVTALPFGP